MEIYKRGLEMGLHTHTHTQRYFHVIKFYL